MYYFHSFVPTAIKINGVFSITVDSDTVSIPVQSGNLIEFLPLDDAYAPFGIVAGKDFDCKYIKRLYFGEDVYLFVVAFPLQTMPFKIILRENIIVGNIPLKVSAVSDGTIKLITETPHDIDVLPLTYVPKKINLREIYTQQGMFCLIEISNYAKTLVAYKIDESLSLCFTKSIDGYFVDDNLTVTKFANDTVNHKITSVWKPDNPFELMRRTVSKPTFACDYPESLLPKLFFEEIFVGGDIKEYVSSELYDNKDLLKEYVGKIYCIIPVQGDNNKIVIIGENSVNLFTVETENGKITNVCKEG